MPEDVIEELKRIAPLLGFSGYQTLIRAYVGQALRKDLLEILDDRHQQRATIATSQLPISKWHQIIAEPALADAILDRLFNNAYKINLKGESIRKTQSKSLTNTSPKQ